jgi:hypothetical protein
VIKRNVLLFFVVVLASVVTAAAQGGCARCQRAEGGFACIPAHGGGCVCEGLTDSSCSECGVCAGDDCVIQCRSSNGANKKQQLHASFTNPTLQIKIRPYSDVMAQIVKSGVLAIRRFGPNADFITGHVILKDLDSPMVVSWRMIVSSNQIFLETIANPPDWTDPPYLRAETLTVTDKKWSLTRDGVDLASGAAAN